MIKEKRTFNSNMITMWEKKSIEKFELFPEGKLTWEKNLIAFWEGRNEWFGKLLNCALKELKVVIKTFNFILKIFFLFLCHFKNYENMNMKGIKLNTCSLNEEVE